MRVSRIVFVLAILATLAYATVSVLGWSHRVGDLTFVSVKPYTDQPGRTVVAVKFRSNINLRRSMKVARVGYVITSYRLCSSRTIISDGPVLHNGIYITDQPEQICMSKNGGPLNCSMEHDTPDVRAEVAHLNDPGPFEYESWFYYEDFCEKEGEHSCEKYTALPATPREDICMRIVNTAPPPPWFTSNEMRIPKEAIARVLAGRRAR